MLSRRRDAIVTSVENLEVWEALAELLFSHTHNVIEHGFCLFKIISAPVDHRLDKTVEHHEMRY